MSYHFSSSNVNGCCSVVITVYGVGGVVSTQVELVNGYRYATGLLDVDSDRTVYSATLVVSAEYLVEMTTGDGEFYVTTYIGLLGASVDFGHTGDTTHLQLR